MNHPTPDDDIEKLLGLLSPAPPQPELMTRLQAAKPPETKILSFWRWSLPLAVAAGIALAFALLHHMSPGEKQVAKNHPAPSSGDASGTIIPVKFPVESRQHLMEVKDLGIVRDPGKEPVRLIRTTWVDELFYETQPGSEPVKEARVRQEVLPVALTSY